MAVYRTQQVDGLFFAEKEAKHHEEITRGIGGRASWGYNSKIYKKIKKFVTKSS